VSAAPRCPARRGGAAEGERKREPGGDHSPIGSAETCPPDGTAILLAPIEMREPGELRRTERRIWYVWLLLSLIAFFLPVIGRQRLAC
jgi:hypothetical protein